VTSTAQWLDSYAMVRLIMAVPRISKEEEIEKIEDLNIYKNIK